MLETELNNTEPNGEERGGARSPEINTAAGQPPADSGPAGDPPPAGPAGDAEVPAAKGRRRAARRPAGALPAGAYDQLPRGTEAPLRSSVPGSLTGDHPDARDRAEQYRAQR